MKKWVCSVCGYVYEGEQPPVELLEDADTVERLEALKRFL